MGRTVHRKEMPYKLKQVWTQARLHLIIESQSQFVPFVELAECGPECPAILIKNKPGEFTCVLRMLDVLAQFVLLTLHQFIHNVHVVDYVDEFISI